MTLLSNVEQTPDNSTLAPDVASASILTDFMPPTVTVAPLEALCNQFCAIEAVDFDFRPLLCFRFQINCQHPFNTDRSAALDTLPKIAAIYTFHFCLGAARQFKINFRASWDFVKVCRRCRGEADFKVFGEKYRFFAVNVAPRRHLHLLRFGEKTPSGTRPVDILVMLFITRTIRGLSQKLQDEAQQMKSVAMLRHSGVSSLSEHSHLCSVRSVHLIKLPDLYLFLDIHFQRPYRLSRLPFLPWEQPRAVAPHTTARLTKLWIFFIMPQF